ncbi:MAG: drug:proton antiporter [Alphaproteobacteria bacterium]|nr:drug:proton antiporter [Alphaproteobacteria bacterium]
MAKPALVLLYVDSVARSAAFYRSLLAAEPVEESPTFAMFPLAEGMMLGLWGRAGVLPAPGPAGGGEIDFSVEDAAAVDRTHAEWVKAGRKIAQAPNDMDFGRTFVALDPDGHRLRVLAAPAS